jgi:hypothetical protein
VRGVRATRCLAQTVRCERLAQLVKNRVPWQETLALLTSELYKRRVRVAGYLPLAAACLVTLVWAGAASALIVPKESISGVELKMTRSEVKEKKGQPDRILHESNDLGPYTEFIYKNAMGNLKVTFQGKPNVTWIFTNRETQKTPEGIHVGSPERALHDAYPRLHCRTYGTDFRFCWTGHLSGPKYGKVTKYRIGIGTGNVTSITVTAIAATVFLDY